MASSLKKSWPPFEYAIDASNVSLASHEQAGDTSNAADELEVDAEAIDTPGRGWGDSLLVE